MSDKTVEELEFHRKMITEESNSPLHLIREKEIEISGRLLAAKRSADEIVSEARKSAAAVVSDAQGNAAQLAEERERAIQEMLKREAATISAQADEDVAALENDIKVKLEKAVEFVLDSVLSV